MNYKITFATILLIIFVHVNTYDLIKDRLLISFLTEHRDAVNKDQDVLKNLVLDYIDSYGVGEFKDRYPTQYAACNGEN